MFGVFYFVLGVSSFDLKLSVPKLWTMVTPWSQQQRN